MVEVDLVLVTYPGLVIETTDANPSSLMFLLGKVFQKSMVDFMAAIVDHKLFD